MATNSSKFWIKGSRGKTAEVADNNLADGSRLLLAIKIYMLPNGTRIEGKGVQSDSAVDGKWYLYLNNLMDDPQIKAVLEELKK